MLIISNKKNISKIPVSAKLKPENKAFIALTQEAINDLLPENQSMINFTETLEFIIEQFSYRNPFILQIEEKTYTVENVINIFLDKYAINQVQKLITNPYIAINIVEKVFSELLQEKIEVLNCDIEDDEELYKSFKICYTSLDEIKNDLAGAYDYLHDAFIQFDRSEFYDVKEEFEMKLFSELKLDSALLCYKPFDESGDIEKNIKYISKLAKLYIYKQENINSYDLMDECIYKNEFEEYINGNFNIEVYINGHRLAL